MIAEEKLRQAIRRTQEEFQKGIGQAGIFDVAFIGNTSGAYDWEPAIIVDIDVFLFVEAKSIELGHWLLDLRDRLREAVDALGADFDLKVIRGPYKPAAWQLARPIVIAHVGVFTEPSYRRVAPATRWTWRKYRCVVEPDRLRGQAPAPPNWQELHALADRKLFRIRAGRVTITEWELPGFGEQRQEFTPDHPIFAEYCLTGPLVCARVHGRILGRAEADHLGNRDFVKWYRREILDTAALEELLALKETARQRGYAGLIPSVRELASQYFTELIELIGARKTTN